MGKPSKCLAGDGRAVYHWKYISWSIIASTCEHAYLICLNPQMFS